MAEEYRFFLRTGGWALVAGAVYWLVSRDVAGTVLLAGLVVATLSFAGAALAFAGPGGGGRSGGILAWLNRAVGFHESPDAPPPLEGGPELIPLSSAWPIVTAAAAVVIGLGVIFGSWLTLPGVVLLVIGLVGWVTQLDRSR